MWAAMEEADAHATLQSLAHAHEPHDCPTCWPEPCRYDTIIRALLSLSIIAP